MDAERGHGQHAVGKSPRHPNKQAVQISSRSAPRNPTMDQKPRKDGHDDFGHFKSEPMKFVLYLVRELRFAFEAAAASKWVTWWTCSAVLVGSASWVTKSLFLP
jgi:hypothetical protein